MAISLKPVNRSQCSFVIRGISPLIQHAWSERNLAMLRDKHAGKKTKSREKRDPEAEGREAMYTTSKGGFGIPVSAIKQAMISAAHKDIGIEKTLVRKSLFFVCEDRTNILPMECSDPVIREDYVRVGAGVADLRYRPEFSEWSVRLTIEYDSDLLRIEDILNLVDRAGFGVGIGEWRPEKGGEYGRFQVDRSIPVETTETR